MIHRVSPCGMLRTRFREHPMAQEYRSREREREVPPFSRAWTGLVLQPPVSLTNKGSGRLERIDLWDRRRGRPQMTKPQNATPSKSEAPRLSVSSQTHFGTPNSIPSWRDWCEWTDDVGSGLRGWVEARHGAASKNMHCHNQRCTLVVCKTVAGTCKLNSRPASPAVNLVWDSCHQSKWDSQRRFPHSRSQRG